MDDKNIRYRISIHCSEYDGQKREPDIPRIIGDFNTVFDCERTIRERYGNCLPNPDIDLKREFPTELYHLKKIKLAGESCRCTLYVEKYKV